MVLRPSAGETGFTPSTSRSVRLCSQRLQLQVGPVERPDLISGLMFLFSQDPRSMR